MNQFLRVWSQVRRHWVDILLPLVIFLLAAAVWRQVQWARSGSRFAAFEERFQAAVEAGRNGDFNRAIGELRWAGEIAPDDARVHLELAQAYRTARDPYQSALHLERAYRLDAPPHEKYVSLLTNFSALGKLDDLERVLGEQVLPRFPESAEAWYFDGMMRLTRAQRAPEVERALASFETSLKHSPDQPKAKYQRAVCLSRLNQFEEAEGLLRDLVKAAPSNATLLHSLASVLRQQGKLDEVRTLTEQLQKQTDLNEHIKYLELQRGVKKASPEQLWELSELYLILNQPALAEAACAQYATAVPEDPRGHRRLAEIYRALDKPEYALSEEKLAQALDRNAPVGDDR